VAGSLLSLWLTFLFRAQPTGRIARKIASAFLMGAALSAMHYTGMAAVRFTASPMIPDLSHAVRLTALGVAGIVTVPWMVLVGTIAAVLVDRIQERSALVDAVFENAPPSVLIDGDRRVIRVNQEFARFFGYTPQEALGRRLVDLITTPDLEREIEESWQSVLRGERVTKEVVRRHKDGSRLHVLAAAVLVNAPGGVSRVCTMYRDITKRKEAELWQQTLSKRLLHVQEIERRHLARELHDEIGQLLTYLGLLLRPDGADSSAATLQVQFERARTVVDDLLAKVRGLSFDLRPADLDQLGLLPALLSLFERYSMRTGVSVDFKHRGLEQRLAPELETGVYRVVQEALTNVARHSGAASVMVRLWTEGNLLKLQIVDQGHGFDLKESLKTPLSSGLYGLQERIVLLGGSAQIESVRGSGTTIVAELPVVRKTTAV
jgi:PAS domain S-box-containing protein